MFMIHLLLYCLQKLSFRENTWVCILAYFNCKFQIINYHLQYQLTCANQLLKMKEVRPRTPGNWTNRWKLKLSLCGWKISIKNNSNKCKHPSRKYSWQKKVLQRIHFAGLSKSWWLDLNRRPADYES